MAKIKKKLNVDAFRATKSMLPPILTPRIAQIDVASPTQKPDDLPKDPLIPPSPKLIITECGQQIISGMNVSPQDKGKQIAT